MLRQTTNRVSRRTALAGLGAGSLGMALTTHGTSVAAQESPSDSLAGHPLVGSWVATTPFGASAETFAADGSFVAGYPATETGPLGVAFLSSGVGVWASTGPRSGHFTSVQAITDATGLSLGTLTIDGYLDVSEDGQSFIDDAPETTLTYRDAAGTVVQAITPFATGDSTIQPVRGYRMAVGAPGVPTAPAAGTPTS